MPHPGRRLVGDHTRDVLLEGHDVDGARRDIRVEGRLDRAPDGQVAADLAQLEGLRRGARVSEARVGAGHARWGRRVSPATTTAPRSPGRRDSSHWPPPLGPSTRPGRRERGSSVPATENGEPEVTITVLPLFSVSATLTWVASWLAGQADQRGAPVEVIDDRLVAGPGQRVPECAPLAHPVAVSITVPLERHRRRGISRCRRRQGDGPRVEPTKVEPTSATITRNP